MKLIEAIENRWSPRAFSNKDLDNESLQSLLEASRWAPSSMNEQPWHYYYSFRNDPGFEKMLNCLVPMNKEWAQNAALLLLSVSKRKFNYKDRANRHAMHDLGAANSMLATQASGMGLQVHQMGGFDMTKTMETFNLDPETFEPSSFIAVGFPGDPNTLNDTMKERELAPRQRKSINEISTHF